MHPIQVYDTTILNRDGGQAFRFVTAPSRSFVGGEVPDLRHLTKQLDFGLVIEGEGLRKTRMTTLEPWSLPFFIDAALGRYPPFPFELAFYFDPMEPKRPRRAPSDFAQYLAYAPVVPFESSPLSPKALSELASAGGGIGGALGAYATGEPLLLLAIPAGIIVCGAAHGIGDALRIGLRTKLLALMGVEDPEADSPAQAPDE